MTNNWQPIATAPFNVDVLMARIFGAGMATDAFFVAFKLPNLLRRMFAEGAFSKLVRYKTSITCWGFPYSPAQDTVAVIFLVR